jgi:hypothetical protein
LRLRLAATELRGREARAALRCSHVELVVVTTLLIALDVALVGRNTADDSWRSWTSRLKGLKWLEGMNSL